MPEYQQRVIDEQGELASKIDRLAKFLDTDAFTALPDDEKTRLMWQLKYMSGYNNVLVARIANFVTLH